MFVLTIGTHSELKPLMKCTGQQESAWHGQNTCCGKPLLVEILLVKSSYKWVKATEKAWASHKIYD